MQEEGAGGLIDAVGADDQHDRPVGDQHAQRDHAGRGGHEGHATTSARVKNERIVEALAKTANGSTAEDASSSHRKTSESASTYNRRMVLTKAAIAAVPRERDATGDRGAFLAWRGRGRDHDHRVC